MSFAMRDKPKKSLWRLLARGSMPSTAAAGSKHDASSHGPESASIRQL
jgi:hypothetical protein